MPYGRWVCIDGREILFDRDYKLICERRPGSPVRASDPEERVDYIRQSWLYNDGTPEQEKRRRAEAILAEWGWLTECLADIEARIAAGTGEHR